ncbi:MAG: YggU family protein [Candidatus Competibacteraceae bacterium]|nr:YggU family protein [Candidatus Competibacteraceae bacterium]
MGGYRWDGADLFLNVRIRPRAGRDQWLEPRGDRIWVRIAAPPVDGKANAQLRAFLAELFGVAQSQVSLLAGESGRDKRLRIAAPRRLPPGIGPRAAQTPELISPTR